MRNRNLTKTRLTHLGGQLNQPLTWPLLACLTGPKNGIVSDHISSQNSKLWQPSAADSDVAMTWDGYVSWIWWYVSCAEFHTLNSQSNHIMGAKEQPIVEIHIMWRKSRHPMGQPIDEACVCVKGTKMLRIPKEIKFCTFNILLDLVQSQWHSMSPHISNIPRQSSMFH